MPTASNRDLPFSSSAAASKFGCHELSFTASEAGDPGNPLPIRVDYRLPSGQTTSVRGFANADNEVKARCYVAETGVWSWECKNKDGRCIATGEFTAEESNLPGKLRINRIDPRRFHYDSGAPYLHFGYNCPLLLARPARRWGNAIDQADQAGFTKIRVLLAEAVGDASGQFAVDRKLLNLSFWDAADQRLVYALQRYPNIQFQITPFGNDLNELLRYGEGDPAAYMALRYAIERFSALPNVHWALTDGLVDTDQEEGSAKNTKELLASIKRMGSYVMETDPWESLITNVANRFSTAPLIEQEWNHYLSLSHVGQVTGKSILEHRLLASKPIALERDRTEIHHKPIQPRYYFRRLFWAALLSGGHPTYEGLDAETLKERPGYGVYGYYDACNAGNLRMGAHDFHHIRRFFADSGITLENWVPDDAIGGNNPLLVKAAKSSNGTECIAYIANPDAHGGHAPNGFEGIHTDQNSTESETFTTFTLELPFSSGEAKWFCPRSGEWRGEAEVTRNSTTLLTPEPGDWIVWVKRD